MSVSAGNNRRPLVVGANHRTSSLGLRDRLFLKDALVAPFLEKLRAHGVEQALVLSTCDRVEVQAAHEDTALADRIILEALA